MYNLRAASAAENGAEKAELGVIILGTSKSKMRLTHLRLGGCQNNDSHFRWFQHSTSAQHFSTAEADYQCTNFNSNKLRVLSPLVYNIYSVVATPCSRQIELHARPSCPVFNPFNTTDWRAMASFCCDCSATFGLVTALSLSLPPLSSQWSSVHLNWQSLKDELGAFKTVLEKR